MPENYFHISIAANALLFLLLLFSIRYNYKFGVIIINVQDAIEKSLDILDQNYAKMNQIVQTPIFFDSVEVRQVISEISMARNSILAVAEILTDTENERK